MATIVKYHPERAPSNAFPERIVSPPFPRSCCAAHMEQVGEIEKEKGLPYYYRRCRICGYTVRHFLPVEPAEANLFRFLDLFGSNSTRLSAETARHRSARSRGRAL